MGLKKSLEGEEEDGEIKSSIQAQKGAVMQGGEKWREEDSPRALDVENYGLHK